MWENNLNSVIDDLIAYMSHKVENIYSRAILRYYLDLGGCYDREVFREWLDAEVLFFQDNFKLSDSFKDTYEDHVKRWGDFVSGAGCFFEEDEYDLLKRTVEAEMLLRAGKYGPGILSCLHHAYHEGFLYGHDAATELQRRGARAAKKKNASREKMSQSLGVFLIEKSNGRTFSSVPKMLDAIPIIELQEFVGDLNRLNAKEGHGFPELVFYNMQSIVGRWRRDYPEFEDVIRKIVVK